MAAQKWKKRKKKKRKMVPEIFGIFEHQLTCNPPNQDSQFSLILPDHMEDY